MDPQRAFLENKDRLTDSEHGQLSALHRADQADADLVRVQARARTFRHLAGQIIGSMRRHGRNEHELAVMSDYLHRFRHHNRLAWYLRRGRPIRRGA